MKFKREKRKMLQSYMQTMKFFNDSTEEILYLCDIEEQKIYFSCDISQRFLLPSVKDNVYDLDALRKFVGSKSNQQIFMNPEAFGKSGEKLLRQEYHITNLDGTKFWIQSSERLQCDENGNPMWIVGRIFEQKDEQKVDPWTGLPNINQLFLDLQECMERNVEGHLMVLGIDNFKNINNKYGRGFGNHVLKNLAEMLENILEEKYRAYRLDGDKFAINGTYLSRIEVTALYEKIQKTVEMSCTLSAGIAKYSYEVIDEVDTIYQRAENALDRAKKNGKNTLEFFSENIYEAQLESEAFEEELKDSINRGFEGFYLVYQPQIDAKDYSIKGAEALLRYVSPTRGLVSPVEFIPVLEQTRLIGMVGEWVLRKSLEQCKKWRAYLPNFHVSVNFSYIQLRSKVIAEHIIRLLDEKGLPGEALTLEVTESVQLQDYQFFNKIFYKLEKHGVGIAIDDFGTGYSSLSYLKSVAINEVKIDRCFVKGIQHSAYNYRLLANMIELSHSANIRVCCEGIETEEELRALKELHPDILQGYLFAKPCLVEELEQRYIQKECAEYQKEKEKQERYVSLGASEYTRDDQGSVELEKMASVVDGMEELVYVCDNDTYELFYMNDAGRGMTGVYDYKGRKCYEVLQNRKSPCEFCGRCKRTHEGFHVWEIYNESLKKHFVVKEKLISWSGRNACLTICIDVTEKETISQKIQERLEFEQNVVTSAKMLVLERDRTKAIHEMLRLIGEFYGANRAYLFELQSNKEFWDNTYEWCKAGIDSEMETLKDVPVSTTQRWYESFQKGESIVIEDVETLKSISLEEYETFTQHNIQSIIAAPVWSESEVVGFIGVDDPTKHMSDSAQIQTLSYFLADRLQKDDTKQRLGELLTFHSEDILKATRLGLWAIHVNPDGKHHRMFADQTMLEVMGIKKKLTPEECYDFWYNRINDGYFHYVNESVEEMIESRKLVELAYTWKHPTKGEVTVRCIGRRVEDRDGMICLEGYHRDINELVQTNFMAKETGVIFEYNENQQTVYFHTERNVLFGDREKEENFPNCWIEQGIVHPHFIKQFKSVFRNVKGQPELDCEEFLLKTKEGVYDWFYLSTKYLSKEARDADTMIVIIEPASQERAAELQHMRMKDFYKATLFEKIAYMEVDMESRHILNIGGLWGNYSEEALSGGCDYLELMMRYKEDLIHPEDKLAYAEFVGKDLKLAMNSENHTKKLEYRRLLDGRMQWIEITAHIFEEQYSENMYALIYLRNIDAQKRRELEQETAATKDALTGVFNRKSFQYQVEMHMKEREDSADSTMILMDGDNFKQINDTYGHAEGDQVIKQLSQILLKTFRRKDVIGRFGGDEFMIFLRNVTDREIINRRLEEFRTELSKNGSYGITCSIGITTVKKEGFSYEKAFKEADEALYQSKRAGKNQYSYYEA